ncbi:MAG: Fic family protein [Bacteroidales bacterium]|nr:Fic family protein [Bacteroidales bacterium]
MGQYKTSPNSVRLRNGEIHEYASPEETPALMNDLLNWYNDNKEILHPVQLAAEFHYKIVCIHPFDDGNGRVARLIMNYILLKNNYPPVIIKSDEKESYLTHLQKADTGDITSLIEYIERQSIWSLELSIKAANGGDIDELGDIEKEIELLKKDKLTKTKIYKTPKVTYELINHINDDLWTPISKVLNKFDDFFAESSNENYLNNIKIEKTKIIPGPLMGTAHLFSDRKVTVKKYEIFGHDLEENDVNNLQWKKKMLSLKSASKKIDYEILCSLDLNDSNYKLLITESNTNSDSYIKNSTTLFEIENEYKTLFMSDTVNSIIRIISNYMIKEIKGGE